MGGGGGGGGGRRSGHQTTAFIKHADRMEAKSHLTSICQIEKGNTLNFFHAWTWIPGHEAKCTHTCRYICTCTCRSRMSHRRRRRSVQLPCTEIKT